METFWYVVKVLPGRERLLSDEFNKKISLGEMKNVIRFICPTEKEVKISSNNKKITREKVIYSGYLYFESPSKLDRDELKVLSGLPNIMGMMGDRTPIELGESDIRRILKDEKLSEHVEFKKIRFSVGEKVLVIDGPFSTFEGVISDVKGERISLEVRIFGRSTPVELNLNQIEKIK
jgi:transcriptional antiterminator NusG